LSLIICGGLNAAANHNNRNHHDINPKSLQGFFVKKITKVRQKNASPAEAVRYKLDESPFIVKNFLQ